MPLNEGIGTETCLDYIPVLQGGGVVSDPRIDEREIAPPTDEYPASSYNGAPELFQNCKYAGYGDLEDPGYRGENFSTFQTKRLSRYRKRQMECNPQYRWLLDIMGYDEGNVVAAPYYEYVAVQNTPQTDEAQGTAEARFNGGTLYNHLIGVVHCEHWYELANCNRFNPQHDDPGGVLGGWIEDGNGNRVGANTSNIAPRFWIYACSGVPIFDFEIERARTELDEFGNPFLKEEDYQYLVGQLAIQKTPRQDIMQKLARAGLFDIGDWRSDVLNDIQMFAGMSYTAPYYDTVIQGYSGDEGACCFGPHPPGPCGPTGPNSSCVFMSGVSCGICGGVHFLGRRCSSDLCVNCSGFKPHDQSNEYSKYLGPVRKRLYVPYSPLENSFGIGFNGITRPAFLDPRKARPNKWPEDLDTFERKPFSAKGKECNLHGVINPNDYRVKTLVDLQLPDDLLPMPWGDFTDPNFWAQGRTLPAEPPFGLNPTEEWKQFKTWRDKQWLYLHAKPGGWDYVCPGFQFMTDSGQIGVPEPRIPNLPRRFSENCNAIGCCLDGVKGWPQRSFQYDGGGCPDITCRYTDSEGIIREAPTIGCAEQIQCVGVECKDTTWCDNHKEQGGGNAPCRNVTFTGDCNGIRFTYYRHRQVGGDGVGEGTDYTTCNGSVRSWVYRVNINTGNYDDFCPHTCRELSTPVPIVDSLPIIQSNRLAAGSLCAQYLQDDNRGRMCPGLYCLSNSVVEISSSGIPIPPYYGNGFGLESHCCGGQQTVFGGIVDGPIPTDSTHPAANRTDCPFFPGGGCLTPNCRFYDGRFVGNIPDFNPSGCCWKCQLQGGIAVPDSYEGIKSFNQCYQLQPDDVLALDGYANNGRGFIYSDGIASLSSCPQLWAGECACGTNSAVPPAASGEFCTDPGASGSDQGGGY